MNKCYEKTLKEEEIHLLQWDIRSINTGLALKGWSNESYQEHSRLRAEYVANHFKHYGYKVVFIENKNPRKKWVDFWLKVRTQEPVGNNYIDKYFD